jgi:hypothetical protein
MKARKLFFLVIIVMHASLVFAQEIELSIGYATYKMDDLRELNKQILRETGLPSKITDDFPGFSNFEIQYTQPLMDDKYCVGGFLSFTSTGSRIAYTDYSGHQYIDQRLTGFSLGANTWMRMIGNENHSLWMGGKAGLTLTSHKIISELTIYSYTDKDKIAFEGVNIFIEPRFVYKYKLSNGFGLSTQVGYNVNVGKGKLNYTKDSNAYLTNNQGEALNADWSGLRLSLGVTYLIQDFH